MKATQHSPRVARQLDLISQFTTDLHHVQGSQNVAADALSCMEVSALHTDNASPLVDFWALALAQVNDPDLARLQTQSSLRLQAVPLAFGEGVSIVCDVSTPVQRPYIPANFHRAIFDSLHGMLHPGIRATRRLVTSRYV